MAIALRFNGQKFYDDLKEELEKTMKALIDEFYRAATSGMSADAKADSDNLGVTEDELEHQINAQCAFYADAILESYGIGSLADTGSNSYWDDYTKSPFFNPARHGTAIVGRPAGEYTNIWGEKETSSGTKAGQLLESKTKTPRKFFDKSKGKWVSIEPKRPTYAIQNVEVWLMQNRETSMERKIEETVIQFIQQVSQNPLEYFYYENVEV